MLCGLYKQDIVLSDIFMYSDNNIWYFLLTEHLDLAFFVNIYMQRYVSALHIRRWRLSVCHMLCASVADIV